MKIAVIGANGKAGRKLVEESLRRGHKVMAIVRENKGYFSDDVSIINKDLFDLTYEDVKGFDAIIDAIAVWAPESLPLHQTSLEHLTKILNGKPNRLLVVGGAGSLYTDKSHTLRLLDSPDFPDSFKPLASSMAKAYDELKKCNDVNWTYLSPAANFVADGEKTGQYIAGKDELITNSEGESSISYADYAIAMIDEVEAGKHIKERFTAVNR